MSEIRCFIIKFQKFWKHERAVFVSDSPAGWIETLRAGFAIPACCVANPRVLRLPSPRAAFAIPACCVGNPRVLRWQSSRAALAIPACCVWISLVGEGLAVVLLFAKTNETKGKPRRLAIWQSIRGFCVLKDFKVFRDFRDFKVYFRTFLLPTMLMPFCILLMR